jgi:hypothetical protein
VIRFIHLSLALTLPLFMFACGTTDDTADTTDSEADADADADADSDTDTDSDSDTDVGFTIEGTTLDLMLSAPLGKGICVGAMNADAAVTGGDVVEMASALTDASGAYSIPGITEKPTFGILLSVHDCKTPGTTVLTSATPVQPASYADLNSGDVLSGTMAFVIDATYRDGIDASLAAMGFTDGITELGGLAGMVLDSSMTPLEGATVTGAKMVFYQDGNPKDGLFTTGGVPNTATIAAGGAFWLIPAAGISTYSAEYKGLSFPEAMAGSSEGSVMILPLIGVPE